MATGEVLPPVMTRAVSEIVRLPATEAAPLLLGMVLRSGAAAGRIVEAEAYTQDDPASHSHRGRTPRNAPMFLAGGHLYVYRSYGVHWCVNVVTGSEGSGEAVLIRALEPLEGLEVMRRRRGNVPVERLCAGPGNVCSALGIEGRHSGLAIGQDGLELEVGPRPNRIIICPRVGIAAAMSWPRRFLVADSPFVSRRVSRRKS